MRFVFAAGRVVLCGSWLNLFCHDLHPVRPVVIVAQLVPLHTKGSVGRIRPIFGPDIALLKYSIIVTQVPRQFGWCYEKLLRNNW